MAIAKMQKVAILAMNENREDLISLLHEEGVVEVRKAHESEAIDHTEVEYREAEVQFAIDTLKKFADKATLAVCARPVEPKDVLHAAHTVDVASIVETLHNLEKNDTEANRAIQEHEEHIEQLQPWVGLEYALNNQTESANTVLLLGTMPADAQNVLRDALTQSMKRSILQKVSDKETGTASFVVILWKEDVAHFEQVATSLGWTNVSLPAMDGTPQKSIEETKVRIRQLEQGIEKNVALRKKLSVELPNLMKIRIFMQWLEDKQKAREALAATDATVTILGWIPAKDFMKLESKIAKLSPATCMLKIKPDTGEEAPVLLQNSKLIQPFESVTTLYGLPQSSEMDPTKSLSPFFALYFGLCLTDAGYGAVIALIFGTYLLVTKKSIEEARLWWLLFMSGIVTFFVSSPFGGWFGLAPEQVPSFLTKETAEGLRFYGQVWNLNQQSGISFLQNLSLILGLTHIFFGVFLAGMHKWIHGNKAGAFWEHFTSHILLGAVIFRVFAPEQLTDIATYTIYGALALMVWGLGAGNPLIVRPIMGALGVVNFAIGLLSNGLSYLRILALGLVTGAIAMAVNQVAVELGNLFPAWIGIPVLLLIAIVGHTVSIALNTLGSFIHSGRLQFIEFFSQFFEGGGRPFAPLKRTTHTS